MSNDHFILVDANTRRRQGGATINGLGIQITNGHQFSLAVATGEHESAAAEAFALLIALRQVPNGCRALIFSDLESLNKGFQKCEFRVGDEALSTHLKNECERLGWGNVDIHYQPREVMHVVHGLADHGLALASQDVRGMFVHCREAKAAFGVVNRGLRAWRENAARLKLAFSGLIAKQQGQSNKPKDIPVFPGRATERILGTELDYTGVGAATPRMDMWVFEQLKTSATAQK